jgi:hypothetical protein
VYITDSENRQEESENNYMPKVNPFLIGNLDLRKSSKNNRANGGNNGTNLKASLLKP